MKNNLITLGLADWICDKEPNYPTFEDCKKWIKLKLKDINPEYRISKKDEEEIKMLLKYLPMSQIMNKKIMSRYLDELIKID